MTSIFQRDYHERWMVEIESIARFLVTPPAQPPDRREEWALVLAILQTTIESMPSGIELATLERVTSCDRTDLKALQIITATTSTTMKFTITDGLCKWLPV
jgi:hypothetical protein